MDNFIYNSTYLSVEILFCFLGIESSSGDISKEEASSPAFTLNIGMLFTAICRQVLFICDTVMGSVFNKTVMLRIGWLRDLICKNMLNPFTPAKSKIIIDKFSKITNWEKLRNKQHHSEVLLNGFPMNGHTSVHITKS